MRLNEDILRFMSIREDKLSEGPSIILNKDTRDRDDQDQKPIKKEVA